MTASARLFFPPNASSMGTAPSTNSINPAGAERRGVEGSNVESAPARRRGCGEERVHRAEQTLDAVVLTEIFGTFGEEGILAPVASAKHQPFGTLF